MTGEGKRSEGAGKPSPFLHHGLVGVSPLHFCKKGVKLVSEGDGLQEGVKHLNMTFFSSQEWVFHPGLSSCPKGQDKSGVAAEEPSGLHQCRELAFRKCRPQTPGQ